MPPSEKVPVARLIVALLLVLYVFQFIRLTPESLDAQIYNDAVMSLSINRPQNPRTGPSRIGLVDLANTHPETECPENMYLMEDKWINPKLVYSHNRRIPKIIHVTGKSRCVSESFRNNLIVHWRNFPDHAFVFYNDAAVDRLLTKHFDEFPQMAQMPHCIRGGAAKADLFRAVVLWEYGGIYTDMDNSLVHLNVSSMLAADDEAFFVVDAAKLLSQFFIAAKPRHPLMFLLVQSTFLRLLSLNDVDQQYAPYVTGPGALKSAFIHYMGAQGKNEPNNANHYTPYHNPAKEGVYRGLGNTTVRLLGDADDSFYYVHRSAVRDKISSYAHMNMTHFTELEQTKNNDSCMNRLYMRHVAKMMTTDVATLAKW